MSNHLDRLLLGARRRLAAGESRESVAAWLKTEAPEQAESLARLAAAFIEAAASPRFADSDQGSIDTAWNSLRQRLSAAEPVSPAAASRTAWLRRPLVAAPAIAAVMVCLFLLGRWSAPVQPPAAPPVMTFTGLNSNDRFLIIRPSAASDLHEQFGDVVDMLFGVRPASASERFVFTAAAGDLCPGEYTAAIERDAGDWVIKVEAPVGCAVDGLFSSLLLQVFRIGVSGDACRNAELESVRLDGEDRFIMVSSERIDGNRGEVIKAALLDEYGLTEIWRFAPGKNVPYPFEQGGPDRFKGGIEVMDLTGDGVREVLIGFNHDPESPSQFVVLDIVSGRLLGEFWNYGHSAGVISLLVDVAGRPDKIIVNGMINSFPSNLEQVLFTQYMVVIDLETLFRSGARGPLLAPFGAMTDDVFSRWTALEPFLAGSFQWLDPPKSTLAERTAALESYLALNATMSTHDLYAAREVVDPGFGYEWYAVIPSFDPHHINDINVAVEGTGAERYLEISTRDGRRYRYGLDGEYLGTSYNSILQSVLYPLTLDEVLDDYRPVIFRPGH
ncbi:hypothetical protein JW905_08865 [bacterium]|nr:hypothetical protein [candidate division CSSED10-310 bacterium]